MKRVKSGERNWRRVSIDEERKIQFKDNYDEFNELVAEIMAGSPNSRKKYKEKNKSAIRSYGAIIVFEDDDSLCYLIGEMRTTIEFTDVIRRGIEPDFIYNYLSLMTEEERQLLLKYKHPKLWDDLLMGLKGFEDRKKFITSKYEKFSKIIPKLIELTTSHTETLPFGFPKGRSKLGDDTGLMTALREVKEEMGVDLGKIILMLDEPIEEFYQGTDGQQYQTIYYVIKAKEKYEPEMTYLDTNIISESALSEDFKNYMWFRIPKNKTKAITPLNERREKMLLRVHKKILNNAHCAH